MSSSGSSHPPSRPDGYDRLNRYTAIIVDEALRRGIAVEVRHPATGELTLTLGDRRITTIESLSELTSAVAFRRCDHKLRTREVLAGAGLAVPPGRPAAFDDTDVELLDELGELVVKPARGEQGWGITVGVVDAAGLEAAREVARAVCPEVLLEQRCFGDDLRIVVIDRSVVAAAVRRPPTVVGTGEHRVAALIAAENEARLVAERPPIPLDEATSAVIRDSGHDLDSVLPAGEELVLRRTANVHTGGTIRDVTDMLHPALSTAAVADADALGIPVVGLDLIVPAIDGPDHVFIEANEQPGLANHEPQPVVERFVDLLFPETAAAPTR